MDDNRRVDIFRDGADQAIRIPKDFELPGHTARIRKIGTHLIIEPVPEHSLLELLATWEPLDEEIGEIPDPPPEPVDL